MTSPRARELAASIRRQATIINLERDAQALAAAAVEIEMHTGVWPRLPGDDLVADALVPSAPRLPHVKKPRLLLILPSSQRARRLLLAGLIHRRA